MTLYERAFASVAVRIDAETAHHQGFRTIRAARPALTALERVRPVPARPVTAMGLEFAHPLGLAAGFDKNAVGIDALAAMGFSFVEVGTVTGQAQSGNPRPRLFRLPDDRVIVNRMGFNNDGAEVVARRLAARAARRARRDRSRPGPVLGVNIGKTKVVDETDEAAVLADYGLSARLLAPYADYLVVNVSSPNTPGLRSLQAVERLEPLLAHVRRTADQAGSAAGRDRVPLLVKIAPDLADDDVAGVADLALALGLDGIVATNTTISRDALVSDPGTVADVGDGGISGPPVAARAAEVLRLLRATVGDDLTIIGVGGIDDVDEARARLAAGATLLQAYTGFVYGGPSWPRRIARGLADQDPRGLMDQDPRGLRHP